MKDFFGSIKNMISILAALWPLWLAIAAVVFVFVVATVVDNYFAALWA